jgi:hypothetical protein
MSALPPVAAKFSSWKTYIPLMICVGALMLAWIFGARRDSKRSNPVRASSVPVPKRWTVDIAEFPDELQTYGGCAVCTRAGEILGWCGHQDAKTKESFLVYIRPPDFKLQGLPCGPGPEGIAYPSISLDSANQVMYVFGGWAAGDFPHCRPLSSGHEA